jgi:hypothetical protein
MLSRLLRDTQSNFLKIPAEWEGMKFTPREKQALLSLKKMSADIRKESKTISRHKPLWAAIELVAMLFDKLPE